MDRVRIAAFFQLMNRPSAIQLFRAVVAADQGDNRLVSMARSYDLIMPHAFVWGEATAKAGADCDPKDTAFAPPDADDGIARIAPGPGSIRCLPRLAGTAAAARFRLARP